VFDQLPNRRQILNNFAALLSGMGLARILTAVSLILVARQVGPNSYGQFVACFSLAKIASVLFSWGLDGWLLWKGGQSADKSLVALNSGVSLTWKTGLGILWFGLLYIMSDWLNPEVFPRTILLMTGLIVWADDMTNTVWSVFKSTLNNDITFRIITLVQLLLLVATGVLVFLDINQLTTYLWARILVVMLGSIWALVLLRRNFGLRIERCAMLPAMVAATPFAGSLILALIYERADVTIVGQFLGQAQAGLYAPASTIVSSLLLIPASAYAVMVPVLTRAYQSPPIEPAKNLFRTLLLVNSVMGMLLALSLAMSAHWLIRILYGERFAEAADVLVILALVLGLRCVTFAVAAALVASGRQKRRLGAQFVAATTNVAVNLMIVSSWGITGVAWVYVATELMLLIGYWIALDFPKEGAFPRSRL
jgi:O-antigen/teichoic acid export membrane protein